MRRYFFIGGVAHELVEEVPDHVMSWKFPVWPTRRAELFRPHEPASRADYATSIHTYVLRAYELIPEKRPRRKTYRFFVWDQLTDADVIHYLNEKNGIRKA